MFKTIVVPTDGSEAAMRAVDVACDLANKYGSKLVLMSVRMDGAAASDLRDIPGLTAAEREEIARLDAAAAAPASVMLETGVGAVPVPPELLDRIGMRLLEATRHHVVQQGIPGPVVKLKDGDPASAIIDVATAEEADTIVMGRRGVGRFAALVGGSVSAKLSGMSTCTLVLVH